MLCPGLCRLKWKVTTLVMCLDCNQHYRRQWPYINVRCHIDVTQLCNDVTLMSHNCAVMSHWCLTIVWRCTTTFNRTMTSHKCTSSPIHIKEDNGVKQIHIQEENEVTHLSSRGQLCHTIVCCDTSLFKRTVMSQNCMLWHISLQEDNYVTQMYAIIHLH